jgi:hypothetical protein
MRIATATIVGIAAYQMSRNHCLPEKEKEKPGDYEIRTWREKGHYTESGQVYIPQMAMKQALTDIARYLSEQIPGKGKATYTKHFESGILITDPLLLCKPNGDPVTRDDVVEERYFCNSDGRRGSAKRVWRHFPTVKQWKSTFQILILDHVITSDIFTRHLEQAGKFKGVGRFRPEKGGFYGRFDVEKCDVKTVKE